jgi:hypothetical protein
VTGSGKRFGLVGAITGQDPVAFGVLTRRRIQALKQSETPSFSFSGTKMQADKDLKRAVSERISK